MSETSSYLWYDRCLCAAASLVRLHRDKWKTNGIMFGMNLPLITIATCFCVLCVCRKIGEALFRKWKSKWQCVHIMIDCTDAHKRSEDSAWSTYQWLCLMCCGWCGSMGIWHFVDCDSSPRNIRREPCRRLPNRSGERTVDITRDE